MIDNLLARIHFIEIIWRTGLALLEFESPFPGGFISTLLVLIYKFRVTVQEYLAHKNSVFLGPYSRTMPRALWWP